MKTLPAMLFAAVPPLASGAALAQGGGMMDSGMWGGGWMGGYGGGVGADPVGGRGGGSRGLGRQAQVTLGPLAESSGRVVFLRAHLTRSKASTGLATTINPIRKKSPDPCLLSHIAGRSSASSS